MKEMKETELDGEQSERNREKKKTSKEMRQIEPGGGNVQSQQKIMLQEQSK